jgi:hypothetical protein
MNMIGTAEQTHRYRVRMGYLEVVVVAHDEVEAISLARQAFSSEFPRFYDLIRALENGRFELQRAA